MTTFYQLMCFHQPRKPEARSCCRHVASSWSNLLMVDSNLLIGFPPSSVASCQVSLQGQFCQSQRVHRLLQRLCAGGRTMAHSSPSLPSSSLSLEYSPTPSAISSLSCAGERFEAAFSAALRRALGERGPPIHVCSEPEPVEFAEGGPSMLNASGDVWINGVSESESDVDEVVVTLKPPELVTGPFTHHHVSRGATATGKSVSHLSRPCPRWCAAAARSASLWRDRSDSRSGRDRTTER